MKIALVILLFGNLAFGSIPEKEITEVFNQRLDNLTTPEAFKKFTEENSKLFPDSTKENLSMIVEREELKLNNETFTLAIGYRQVAIKSTKADFLKSLWSSPELFQKIYNLDAASNIDDSNSTKNRFKARIFKKVPAIGDQDYILDYTVTHKSPFTFIRAKLDIDQKGFALRDNLKVLEETKDGLVVREISYLYPLKWYVRALGPTTRSLMKEEINKISYTEKCLIEESTQFPPNDETLKKCVKN